MDKVTEYLKKIGSVGGRKSRRILTPDQAKKMVDAREAKRKAHKKLVS